MYWYIACQPSVSMMRVGLRSFSFQCILLQCGSFLYYVLQSIYISLIVQDRCCPVTLVFFGRCIPLSMISVQR